MINDLPPLISYPDTTTPLLPAGAQLIFSQARNMERLGGVAAAVTLYWELNGPLDEAAMCRAIDILALSRDYLHLELIDEESRGAIKDAEPAPSKVENIAPRELAAEMSAWSTRPPLAGKPSCTLRLIQLEKDRYALGLYGPHDLLDIWTINKTLAVLALYYNNILENRPIQPDNTPDFKDFSAWYDRLLASDCLEPSRMFWQRLLEGTSPIFTSPPAPDTSSHPLQSVQSVLPMDPDTCRDFEDKTRAAGASIFEGYFTLFNLAMAKTTGKAELLTAFVASLRRIPGLEEVEGCMLNRFYIPVRLPREHDFTTVLREVSQTLRSAKPHCLWPTWKDLDPEGTGYPGVFFHYVPPEKGPQPEFRHLSVSRFTPVSHNYWPHPMSFQVSGDPDKPALFAIGQSGFCNEAWLKELQKTFADLMVQINSGA